MTYSNLTAPITLLRAGNDDVLTEDKYSNSALIALNKESSLAEMKFDIQAAIPIEYDDTTTLDLLADKYSDRLARALAYKQLATFYQKNDTGAGTKNRARWEMYQKLYERERFGFGGLALDAPTANITSVIFKR